MWYHVLFLGFPNAKTVNCDGSELKTISRPEPIYNQTQTPLNMNCVNKSRYVLYVWEYIMIMLNI